MHPGAAAAARGRKGFALKREILYTGYKKKRGTALGGGAGNKRCCLWEN